MKLRGVSHASVLVAGTLERRCASSLARHEAPAPLPCAASLAGGEPRSPAVLQTHAASIADAFARLLR
jgi:hypothetical protein